VSAVSADEKIRGVSIKRFKARAALATAKVLLLSEEEEDGDFFCDAIASRFSDLDLERAVVRTGAVRELKAATKGRLDDVAISNAVDILADIRRTIMVVIANQNE
jgi:hypothetical protein